MNTPLAAAGRDIRLGGGAATVRESLGLRRIDSLHVAVPPVLPGQGEALFQNLDLTGLGYRVVRNVGTKAATRLVIEKD